MFFLGHQLSCQTQLMSAKATYLLKLFRPILNIFGEYADRHFHHSWVKSFLTLHFIDLLKNFTVFSNTT